MTLPVSNKFQKCYYEDSNVFGQDNELLSEQFLLQMTAITLYSMSSSFLLGPVICDDEGITIVGIIGSYSLNNTVSHPKTLDLSTISFQEPQT